MWIWEYVDIQTGIAIFGILQTLLISAIGWMVSRKMKWMDARAALRAEESLLSMQMLSATMNLSVATAIAVRDKKVNGVMERALDDADQTAKSYRDFVDKVAAKQIAKS